MCWTAARLFFVGSLGAVVVGSVVATAYYVGGMDPVLPGFALQGSADGNTAGRRGEPTDDAVAPAAEPDALPSSSPPPPPLPSGASTVSPIPKEDPTDTPSGSAPAPSPTGSTALEAAPSATLPSSVPLPAASPASRTVDDIVTALPTTGLIPTSAERLLAP